MFLFPVFLSKTIMVKSFKDYIVWWYILVSQFYNLSDIRLKFKLYIILINLLNNKLI